MLYINSHYYDSGILKHDKQHNHKYIKQLQNKRKPLIQTHFHYIKKRGVKKGFSLHFTKRFQSKHCKEVPNQDKAVIRLIPTSKRDWTRKCNDKVQIQCFKGNCCLLTYT